LSIKLTINQQWQQSKNGDCKQQAIAMAREKEQWNYNKKSVANGKSNSNNPLVAVVGDGRQWHSNAGAMAIISWCRGNGINSVIGTVRHLTAYC